MPKFIKALERKIGVFWAYFLLFIISWMLLIVFYSLLQVNLVNTENHENSKKWNVFLDGYFKDKVNKIRSSVSKYEQLDTVFYKSGDSAIGVAKISNDYKIHLLDLVSSTDFPKLNFLVNKRLSNDENQVVTAVYPETEINKLFYGIGINAINKTNFNTKVTLLDEFSYGFVFLENRYFLFLMHEYSLKEKVIFLYDLNSVLMEYLDKFYKNDYSKVEIQSRFLTKLLHEEALPNLHISKFIVSWEEYGLPVRYDIEVPIKLSNLNFNWVLIYSALTNILLYLFLYYYDRFESNRNWRNNKNNRFSQFVDGSFDVIILTNSKGVILHCNRSALDMMLLSNDSDIVGKNIKDILYHPNTSQRLSAVNTYKYNLKTLTTLQVNNQPFHAKVSLLVFKEIGEVLISIQDVTSEYEKEVQLQYNATYDSLTGFQNRYSLIRFLTEYFANKDFKIESSLFFIDLDGVRYVNENLGHTNGDKILQVVTKRLSHILSSYNKRINFFRFGGDKFILFIEDITKELTVEISENLINEFQTPILFSNHDVNISLNIGIARLPYDAKDLESLLRNADMAIADSKSHGRNNFSIYDAEMAKVQSRYQGLSIALERAIVNDEFTLFYQPIICLKSGEVISAEALLRWNTPQFGHVSPSEFIPVAEKTGVINDIGKYVYEQACQQLNEWTNTPLKNIRISINISPVQFRNGGVFDELSAEIQKYDFDPNRLHIELTETSVLEDEKTSMDELNKLKNAGFHLSIDDFGTGYSSLSYLNKNLFSTIKIDMSFIRGLPYEMKDVTLTSAIINLGHSLGLNIVAEGVENIEQLNFLKENECDFYQGYHSTPPLGSDDFKVWYLNYTEGLVIK